MSTAPITSKTLDPIAIQIAVLIGLLRKKGDDTYELNESWFSDPWSYISKVPANPQMFELITTLMGSASGNALGTPTQALNRTWYPIMNTSVEPAKSTGLYIVSGTPDGETHPELGIGSLYTWAPSESFTILPYAYFPLFTLPDENGNGFRFVLGADGHPIQTGIQVNGGNNFFSTGNGANSLSFDGFNAGADFSFAPRQTPTLNLVFQNLRLPGEDQGSNRSIVDLIENTSVPEWITVALSVIGSQLAEYGGIAGTAGKMINTLMQLLGLTGAVPSVDWNEIVSNPASTGKVLTKWMRDIAAQPVSMKAWLNSWYCLFNGLDATRGVDYVTGSGSRVDPFAVEVLKLQITSTVVVHFDIGFSVITDPDTSIRLYPDLIIRSKPIMPLFGYNTFGVDVRALIELLEFKVPPTAAIGEAPVYLLFPGVSLMATAANTQPGQPLFSVGEDGANFSIDMMQVGFTYDRSSYAVSNVPTPNFNLINVQSSIGSWPVIDLALINEQAVLEAIGPAVSAALQSFFGENNPYANAFEAVLGIAAPANYTGTWPLSNQLLLSPSELPLLIENPFNALGAYYTRCLSTTDGNSVSLFTYLLPSFVVLLGGNSSSLSGTGTSADPWSIPVLTLGTATMRLQSWTNGSNPAVLNFGFGFHVPVLFSGVTATSDTVAEILSAQLPAADGSGSWSANWMQGAYTRLTLTSENAGPLSTPAMAGVTLEASSVMSEAGWLNGTGFYASASINNLKLKSSSTTTDLGTLTFGTTDWSVAQLEQFAPAIVNGTGILTLENGGRIGVTTATLLGLLPDLQTVLNGTGTGYDFDTPALALPANWPVLSITNFSNPWTDVITQLSNIYAGGTALVMPGLQMLGWGLTGTLPATPVKTGQGTKYDPWQVQLAGAPLPLNLLTWLTGSNQMGWGIGYPLQSSSVPGVLIDVSSTVRIPGFTITPTVAKPVTDPSDVVLPELNCVATLSNTDPLLPLLKNDTTGITIGSVQLGFSAQLQNGTITYQPVFVFLNSRVTASGTLGTYELTLSGSGPQWTCPQGMPSFNALINALMEKISETLGAGVFAQLDALTSFLTDLRIVVPEITSDGGVEKTTFGFNASAWNALLADPGQYFIQHANAVLNNSALTPAFVQSIETLLGISPSLPGGFAEMMAALGLAELYGTVYMPDFKGWLELVKNPTAFISHAVAVLFNNSDLMTTLVSQLSPYASSTGWFSIDTSGEIVSIGILPTAPVVIGNELQLSAQVIIDLNAFSLSVETTAASQVLGSALQYIYTPAFTGNTFSGSGVLSLTSWTDGTFPAAFPPLQLWPIPQDTTTITNQLAVQVPVTLLSAFTTSYLNTFAAEQNPAVLNLMQVMGLTFTDDSNGVRIRPLEGIFMHPADWLLSPAVLGNAEGGIDLSKLGGLLYAVVSVTGISSGDVKLLPYSHDGKNDGLQLTGLPWGSTFILYSNNTEGVYFSGSFAPAFAAPLPQLDLKGWLTFGTGNGLNIGGTAALDFDFGTNGAGNAVGLQINTGYEFGRFALEAVTKIGSDTTSFELLPFMGLNQFLSGLSKVLLETVGDMMFAAYDSYIATHPNSSLKGFVTNIEALTGITSGVTLYNFFAAIAADPLASFTPAKIQGTVSGMYQFMTNILMIDGFNISEDKNYLEYLLTVKSLPQAKMLIQVGIRKIDTGNGLIDTFGIWVQPTAQFDWITLGLSGTGIGVETPFNLQNPNLVYSANFTVGINTASFGVEGLPSPTLLFGVNGTLQQLNGPFLQLFPVAVSDVPGTLRIDLLPNCKLVMVGSPDISTTKWMLAFGTDFLVPLVANLALSTSMVKGWLDDTTIGTVKGAPGIVLVNWGLLVKTPSGNYVLSNLKTAFDASDPTGIVTKLIFSALDLLDGQCVVPIKNKGIYIQSRDEATQKRYGVRIEIPDIIVSSGPDTMTLTFQLGKFYANQTKDNNWTGIKSDPGLTAFFITRDKVSQALSFWPRFELMSVGFDFSGPNAQKPLVNLNGVTINAVKPRVLVVLDLQGQDISTQFGAASMIDTIGIPLGPGFSSGGGSSNPVAQNLLTSGGNPGKTDAINPAFSVSAAYVYNGSGFTLQLYDASGLPTEKVIIPVMRAFGPLQCRKVGIGWESGPQLLDILFDGSVSLAGLTADVQDLEIGIPVTDPTNFDGYTLDLAGLDVSFKSGSVEITGGFLKDDSLGFIQYIGQAQIRAANFGLGAFGAYALVDNNVSLFIFAYLNAPIGGPPYLFVKGLSGGFGYNRAINLPRADEVYTFPLVAGITNPAALGGTNGNPPTNVQALQALGTKIVPPQLGSYWLAAGIKFTSFELIDSQAMLVVQFGTDFMIGLLGLSGLQLPKTGTPYVGAQMAFTVTFRMSTGLLAMEAVLTPNSYVLSRDCRLTGGMAFYVWFKDQPDTGASAGDFVFTLGGYSDKFNKPTYFPDEPRLGFSWVVGDVSIKGGAYFALTPSAVMAGGSLEAVYKSGNLKAWFKAWADFLIMWKPFHFYITVGINVGASYTVKFIWTTTFKVELGAELVLWGPPTAGKVTVKWWVISFTVKFGDQSADKNGNKIIEWNQFTEYFLPPPHAPNPPPQQRPDDGSGMQRQTVGDPLPVQQVTQIRAMQGLIQELDDAGKTLWQVSADQFRFSVNSVAPVNFICYDNNVNARLASNSVQFGIRPLGSVVFNGDDASKRSYLSVTILYNGVALSASKFNFEQALNGVPWSLWGTVNDGNTKADSKIVPGALVGLGVISVVPAVLPAGPPMFPLSRFVPQPLPFRAITLWNTPWLHPAEPAKHDPEAITIISQTVMTTPVPETRTAILETVLATGINVKTDGSLAMMAAYAQAVFQSSPMLGTLGSIGYEPVSAQTGSTRLRTGRRQQPETNTTDATEFPPEVRFYTLQYPRPVLNTSVFLAASSSDIKKIIPVKGSLYRSGLLASETDKAFMLGVTRNSSEDDLDIELVPGSSATVDFDGTRSYRVTTAGELPLYTLQFDVNNQYLGGKMLNDGESLDQFAATTQALYYGFDRDNVSLPYALGWHITYQLIQVNPNALTGLGAVVIPQSPIRVLEGRRSLGYGLIDGNVMMAQNRVETNSGSREGSVLTILPSTLNTIVVLFSNAGSPEVPDQDRVTVSIRVQNEYETLTPVYFVTGALEYAVIYQLPATADSLYEARSVAAEGWEQTGVLALSEMPEQVYENWESVVLKPAVADSTAGLSQQVNVNVQALPAAVTEQEAQQ